MAVPGFSVSDLIHALGQVKMVYDAFFNEYTSSASQLRDLADDIEQFRKNLKKHEEIIEEHGLEHCSHEAIQRTLDRCTKFLEAYKQVLDKWRRKSVAGAIKTARFAFEQDEINQLRAQISRHDNNILHFSVNIVLENSLRSTAQTAPVTASSIPLAIPGASSASTSPPPTPILLGSPLITQNGFSPKLSGLDTAFKTSSPTVDRPLLPLLESPRSSFSNTLPVIPKSQTSIGSVSSINSSPQLQGMPKDPHNGAIIPGLVLPQAALPYRVAEVYFGTKKVDLKRKPAGRDSEGGREMIIVDQDGNPRFKHRMKIQRNEYCFPYTWHRRWQNDHNTLEVGFKNTSPEMHSVSFKGMQPINAIPKYIFTERQDFEDFQSEIRGKHLEDTFEIRQILSASSSKNGEATDQHLKIWRDHITLECSVSFYASAAPKPRHLEFQLAMFEQQLSQKGNVEIYMNFIGAEPKRARTFSKTFSRSPAEKTASSSSTTIPGVFTRNNTGIASSASSATTANSRMSVASFQSESGQSQSGLTKTENSVECQARQMKYLKIEFSDEIEASRFRETYEKLYREEMARPLDFFLNWQMNVGQQRPESVLSTSPVATPFSMSPELRPIRARVPTEDC